MKIYSIFHYLLMQKQTGFTLLEVLIALVVLAIGLLGLAGLQATALKDNLSAYHRSQATIVAYDTIDRMRANLSAIDNYRTVTPAQNVNCIQVSNTCTPIIMTAHDLFELNATLLAVLPSASSTITTDGTMYTITINWDDNRDGSVDANDPNFQATFQP
jgi:type IV pilus assembly protein PilV